MASSCVPEFRVARTAQHSAVQTLAGSFVGRTTPRLGAIHGFDLWAIPLRDGGQLEGRLRRGPQPLAVLLLHGLGADMTSPLMRRLAWSAARLDCTVLALDQRGSGGAFERSDKPYMTGHTADVADALLFLRAEEPTAQVAAIGISLAGNTLLQLVARGPGPAPDFTIAIAPPIDLEHASARLARWPARLFERAVLRRCNRWTGRYALPGIRPRRLDYPTLRAFDEAFIAPLWGFASLTEYYAAASAIHSVHRITTPTLVLAADDDPLAPSTDLVRAPFGPGAALHVTRGGGHLGWLGASHPSRSKPWLEATIEGALVGLMGGAPAPLRPEGAPCNAR